MVTTPRRAGQQRWIRCPTHFKSRGSDAGRDGATPSPEGVYPLICATGEDVLDNFRRRIARHIDRRGGPRRCVIATSEELTPQRRDNIFDAAKEMDVRID